MTFLEICLTVVVVGGGVLILAQIAGGTLIATAINSTLD